MSVTELPRDRNAELTPESRSPRCIRPVTVDGNDLDAIEKMLSSHHWRVRSSRKQKTGLYVAFVCRECGAERIAMVHLIPRPVEVPLRSGA